MSDLRVRRAITEPLKADLDEKIILLSGPRQCGKTTLAKALFSHFQSLSYDAAEDRKLLAEGAWDRAQPLIVFDEIHKMKRWKSWIKCVYDKEGIPPRLLVTGSARMNQFQKTGDSLAGRHLSYRLHPFDLNELRLKMDSEQDEAFQRLLEVGGFPEPYLKGTRSHYNRWSTSHLDVILRQDLIDLESIRDIKSIEILISLLAERVGTPVSSASLANLLQKDPKTITRWLEVLEDLFVIFRVTPFHKNLARAIRKEPKFYFYDTARVRAGRPAAFENLVACALFKEVQRLADVHGVKCELNYLKTKEGKEIDFLVHFENSPAWLIEVKEADDQLSPNFKAFETHFKNSHRIQLVANLKTEKSTAQGHRIVKAARWLSSLELVAK